LHEDNTLGNVSELESMKYSEHLKELRKRAIYIISGIFVVFLSLLPFAHKSYTILSEPLVKILPKNSSMIATDVMSTFLAPFKLNLYLAVLMTIPFTIYHLWKFIEPALYNVEKKLGLLLILSSSILFFLGILFSYSVILPLALKFFIYASPENVLPMTDINSYLSFCLKVFLAFGFAFQIPVITFILILTYSVVNLIQKEST